ncbi:dihydroorotate dehydrogenase electron transfer subunit [Natroniella sulfidigena]|uniref:dihydroorotate dehydrogenase electron transfer subunit n=1 Tax=Natroniella sulfidigena TaxID=723921 RepID=UPI00200AE2C4|nr:dihydroorotate dehydrogenase electron transfer subunit [Natroniella sulfidigena]MCK8817789.1 dihydroorotate dehydrogenase electron transfer subunit [Natroniella sulfidigena]
MAQRVIREIVEQQKIGPGYFKLVIKAPEIVAQAKIGQFVHIKWIAEERNSDPLLRRPISINRINHEEETITLVYRVVGRGTKVLSNLKPGDQLDIMGPLGTGFSISEDTNRVLVIGGGVGIAPLYPLVNKLIEANKEVILLLGAETAEEVIDLDSFQEFDLELKVATMDGSLGKQGFVTDYLEELEQEMDYIYTCGPTPMMKVIRDWAIDFNVPGQASLEERMGCGTGACLSCVCQVKIEGKDGWTYKQACTAGPVFPLREVIFDE